MRGQQSCRHCNRGTLKIKLLAAISVLEDMLGCQINNNSGCRCLEHNSATPGASPTSQHITRDMFGKPDPDGRGGAVDVWSELYNVSELYWAVVEIPTFYHGGIGIYFNGTRYFLHLDQRGYKHRFAYKDGKRISFDEALAIMETFELPYTDGS